MVLLLSSVDHVLHPNLINCESPKAIWDKLKALYGETNEDEITSAWQQYYAYNIVDSEPINTQIEKFESLYKALTDSGEKLSEKSIISKLLSSLTPRFSAFRMAWECTAKDEQRLTNLTARLIREDKRLKDSEESEMMTALQVNVMKKQFQQMKMRQETHQERQERLNKVRELKKRTRCHKCGKIGHWKRECTEQAENDEHQEVIGRESQTYVCEVSALNTEDFIQEKDIWIADSGASMHMTWRREIFQNFNPSETIKHVKIADDKLLPISGTGVVNIQVDLNGKVYDRTLSNVLLVPGLKRNLFSVGAVNDKKFSFHAYEQHCEVRDQGGELSSVGVRYGNLYRMLFKVKDPECNITTVPTLKLRHERMGHININSVKETEKVNAVEGLKFKTDKNEDFFCEPCTLGKQTRKPHKTVIKNRNFKPGEMIHTDVCGPVNTESPRGSKYFLLFKDECTGYRVVLFLRHKSEVFEEFRKFENVITRQTGNKIKVLRSDNGTEYLSTQFKNFLSEKGIIHELSSPYIHEQNGSAEREIRTLVDNARSMMIAKNVPKQLWTEAVNTAAYILNRAVTKKSHDKTPYECWFGCKPEVHHLRTFGSNAYLSIPKEKRKKFDPKSRKMIFVGYDKESKNYRLWDKESQKIYVSSDVIVYEKDVLENGSDKIENNDKIFSFDLSFGDSGEGHYDVEGDGEPAVIEQVEERRGLGPQRELDEENQPGEIEEEDGRQIPQHEIEEENREQPNQEYRERLRNRLMLNQPDLYGNPVAYTADIVPNNYKEVLLSLECEKWKQAMEEEMSALRENRTWELQKLPPGHRAIGCRWVFALKTGSDGQVIRYKARLVAKGFSQQEGIDYFETFAPVVRYESIRVILALCAREDLEIMQFDVKTAFLNGELEETIFMERPEGFKIEPANLVCKLIRSLYGLKQSPKCWNIKFVKFLKNFGFEGIDSDKCVFVAKINGQLIYLVLYVDDGLIASKCKVVIKQVLNYLEGNFKSLSMLEINLWAWKFNETGKIEH